MKKENGFSCCGCLIVILVNLTLGAWCFSYSLSTIFDKDAPWILDVLGGLVLGELTIPVALICWILTVAGVPVPFLKV
jgi:hypothetical protein